MKSSKKIALISASLLSHLYRPAARVSSPVLRNKCARLIAFAVLATEKAARNESGHRDVSGATPSDEVGLTRLRWIENYFHSEALSYQQSTLTNG